MLYEKVNYTQDIALLKNTNIYEYDIAKANISVLLNRGQIDSSLYDFLFNQDNMVRKIMVGNMEKLNKQLIKEKQQGIIDAKKYLFEANHIQDNEVLSIKNDAVFITRELDPNKLQYGNARFTLRNRYNLFIRILRLQLFYLLDQRNNLEVLDIKGIKDEVLEKQEDYMVDFIKELLFTFMTEGAGKALLLLRTFNRNYMNRELDINYYRDLYTGRFPLDTGSDIFSYSADALSNDLVSMVNIVNNGSFLRAISKVLYTEYLRKK